MGGSGLLQDLECSYPLAEGDDVRAGKNTNISFSLSKGSINNIKQKRTT
jgi:hypothetical protein